MSLVLDPFYPVVDSADWVERLVPLGTRLIQLRIKDQPAEAIRAAARRARTVCVRHGAVLILNDYWRMALEQGVDFVHLGQEDLDTADVPALKAAGVRIGLSTHDHDELDRALGLDPDYIALGPIYPTRLKAMRFAPQGLPRLGEWKQRVGAIPLVAIGGITVDRAADCLAAGADSIAVVTDLLTNAEPEIRLRRFLDATAAYRRAV